MEQMTVEKLWMELGNLMKLDRKNANKKIVLADDNEANGFHGCFYSITSDPKAVKENIEVSNGLYDSVETDPNKIVIIG